MKKTIIGVFILNIFILSCSSQISSKNFGDDTENNTFNNNTTMPDISSPDYLDALDEKYPYLAINLSAFKVTDKDSPLSSATAEDNINSRVITVGEKEHILKAIDIMRFALNTPEFKEEYDNDTYYQFRSSRDYNGTERSIKQFELFDKNIVWAILTNAKITTYILKENIGSTANAIGTHGPSFYTSINLENPVVEGDKNDNWIVQDLLIGLPNTVLWNDSSKLYGDEYELASIIFHELIHNLGFNHHTRDFDTADTMEDLFYTVVSKKSWQNKYKDEIENFKYYRTKYEDFLLEDTKPIN